MHGQRQTVGADGLLMIDAPIRLNRKPLHAGWSFRQSGEQAWLNASVPGCNFNDLLQNGVIEDPFYRTNEAGLQWIENCDWEYRCCFDLSQEELQHNINLVFEGLDTYANVSLNGRELLSADNMFRTYRVDCRDALVVGNNELVVVFRSPTVENLPLHEANGFTYPAENDKSEERLSVYARKAPYHFGWDWGPRFVTSGIWRSVYLECYERARIDDVRIRIADITESQARLTFDVQCDVSQPLDAELSLRCREHDEVNRSVPVRLTKTANHHQLEVILKDPVLWWPNGLGDPHLYHFDVSLSDGSGALDQQQHRVGIRTVEVVNEPDAHGESFFLKVNGHPLFAKGANYIPSDSFLDRVSNDKYERVFEAAVAANMNMLRVWGGGVYECDAFYDLADENGILIWQDFMFACSLYPANDEFLHSVRHEAIDNITRLRNHPCIALWCGNNEIEMGIDSWDWPEKFGYSQSHFERLKKDYQTLFRQLLPQIVAEEDGERYYLPSSPISFWENDADDGVGNAHFWGVWHGTQDFEEYRKRVFRFVTEYGFQSFPVMDSVRQFSEERDWHIDSDVMRVHQRHPIGNQLILDYLGRAYPEPDNFEQFLYLSQVQQADGLRIAFEAHRSAMPRCMGTLYWQLNDCWPVASWSGIDYYGRWKALHYQARRSFEPLVAFADVGDSAINILVVSDFHETRAVDLSVQLIDFDGDVLWSREHAVHAQPNQSAIVSSLDRSELLSRHDSQRCVLVVQLHDDGAPVSQATYYFAAVGELALDDPRIRCTVDSANATGQTIISLSSDTLAKSVYVRVDGLAPHINLSDNFFDLLPGQDKLVRLPAGTLVRDDDVSVLSIFDARNTHALSCRLNSRRY